MAKMTKKAAERLSDAAFQKHGVHKYNIMDLSKIHDAGVVAALAGQDVDQAVIAACEKYRVPEEFQKP